MSTRFSAVGLTDDVLEAAASKGLLRRARRDVEAGLVEPANWDGGTAVLRCDGETVRLPVGPLAAATCTCPASGACRHVLAGVVALRDVPPSTTDAPDPHAATGVAVSTADAEAEIRALTPGLLTKSFGRAALVRAEALLATLDLADIVVEAGSDIVRIRLGDHPDVHFPAGAGPNGMISKAARNERAVLHAAALLAVLRPPPTGGRDTATEATVERETGVPAASNSGVSAKVGAVLRDAARQALSSAPAALEERVGELALSSRVEAMPRLAAELRTVAAALRRRRERRDENDPRDVLNLIARCYALARALDARPSDPALTGAGRAEPELLPETCFLGCGVELWRTANGARGATVHMIRASDGKAFSATLARGAGADPSFIPEMAARSEAVFGQTLERLAGGAFRLAHGAAGENGRLALREGRAAMLDGSWLKAADASPDAIHNSWQAVDERLRDAFRPAIGERQERSVPLLLRPAQFGPLSFDGAAQAGRMAVADATGSWLELEIAGNDRLESHFEALDAARKSKPPPLLSVLARLQGSSVVLSPLGLGANALRSLDLPVQRALPRSAPSLFSEWAKRFDLSGPWRGNPGSLRFERTPPASPLRAQLLAGILDELLALAELGGRMEDPDRLQRLEDAAESLRLAGLATPALLLQRLAASARPARAHHLLVATYALGVLSGLEPHLPFVQPIS